MGKIIFHIDANSAFLSWSAAEKLKTQPDFDIRKIPAVVGGQVHSRKGIVLAASIPAKQCGVKTGEPLFMAIKKCPNLHIEPPDFPLYEQYSKKFYDLCNYFSPELMKFSIDELFLNYTDLEKFWGPPVEGAEKIRKAINEQLGFTVNIGISTNNLLAKTASDFEKPNKIHTLFPDELSEKYWPLPIGNMFMVGKSTREQLEKMGIYTIGQLAQTELSVLRYHFKTFGLQLYQYARGISTDDFKPIEIPKSLGCGITTPSDLVTKTQIERVALALTQKAVNSLREQKLTCESVEVALKRTDFSSYSHRVKTTSPLDNYKSIFVFVKQAISEMWDEIPLRAVSVRLCNLEIDAILQYTFFDDPKLGKNREIQNAIDSIRQRYGYESITNASLIKDPVLKRVPHTQPLDITSKL
ncbi:MAG: DNA polymerase IV [Clostridia bacterium]|nr:DNA polymerase IV [Clostridia bacterium]